MIKVQNITSKGQITLPVSWRRQFPGTQIMLSVKNKIIEISHINVSENKNLFALSSESSLSKDWLNKKEEKAWQNL